MAILSWESFLCPLRLELQAGCLTQPACVSASGDLNFDPLACSSTLPTEPSANSTVPVFTQLIASPKGGLVMEIRQTNVYPTHFSEVRLTSRQPWECSHSNRREPMRYKELPLRTRVPHAPGCWPRQGFRGEEALCGQLPNTLIHAIPKNSSLFLKLGASDEFNRSR